MAVGVIRMEQVGPHLGQVGQHLEQVGSHMEQARPRSERVGLRSEQVRARFVSLGNNCFWEGGFKSSDRFR